MELRLRGKFQGLQWNINKDGKLIISYGDNQIILDGPNDNIEVTAAKGVTINANSENVEINSDGDTKVNSNGKVEVAAADSISFSGPDVALGSVGASQSGVLGDILKGILEGHTHPGDSGGTTGPMNQSMASALSSKIKLE
jgi:phage gp45-like